MENHSRFKRPVKVFGARGLIVLFLSAISVSAQDMR
jgi:hypothetical protein